MDRFKLIALLSFSILICCSAFNADDSDLKIDIRRLSDRVIVLTAEGFGNSTVAIASERGIVVIDTNVSPPIAKALREAISREFERSDFVYTINTHDHGDHTYGNQVFADTTIIGHDNCVVQMVKGAETLGPTIENYRNALNRMKARIDSMDSNLEETKAQARRHEILTLCVDGWEQGFEPTPPNLTFSDRMSIDLGDMTLELIYFGKAHSNNDILVFSPEEGLLLVGDITSANGSPYIDKDRVADLPRWIETLEGALHSKSGIKHIVNGHNNFITLEDMESQLAYIKDQYEYTKDKESFLPALEKTLDEGGIEAAQRAYDDFKTSAAGKYYFLEKAANGLGYQLLCQEKIEAAIAVFKMIVDSYPESWNAWDSLGEAYMTHGDTAQAIESYQRSLELNPENDNAARQIERMREEKQQ